jgi:hypothetical protein
MRLSGFHVIVAALMSLTAVTIVAGPRRWQTGTLVDAGRKHDNAIGGAASQARPPANPGGVVPTFNGVPEVGTYIIETAELRLELEAMVPAAGSELERQVSVGQPITFALEKNTVHVRLPDGREQRLRVVKKSSPKKQP